MLPWTVKWLHVLREVEKRNQDSCFVTEGFCEVGHTHQTHRAEQKIGAETV